MPTQYCQVPGIEGRMQERVEEFLRKILRNLLGQELSGVRESFALNLQTVSSEALGRVGVSNSILSLVACISVGLETLCIHAFRRYNFSRRAKMPAAEVMCLIMQR